MTRKTVSTEKAIASQNKTGERLEALIKGEYKTVKITRRALAAKLYVSESSMRNYIKGRQRLPKWVAESLEHEYNIPAAFWLGESDCYTMDEYENELLEKRDDKERNLWHEFNKISSEREILFRQLGYHYECQPSAKLDFIGLSRSVSDPDKDISMIESTDPQTEGLHVISNYTDPDDPVSLSGEELQRLIGEMKSFLSFQLYKIRKRDDG